MPKSPKKPGTSLPRILRERRVGLQRHRKFPVVPGFKRVPYFGRPGKPIAPGPGRLSAQLEILRSKIRNKLKLRENEIFFIDYSPKDGKCYVQIENYPKMHKIYTFEVTARDIISGIKYIYTNW